MDFWHKCDKDKHEIDIDLPPLTDSIIASVEADYGAKFPKSLIELLKTKNGGYLENPDFKFNGGDYQVREIYGLHPELWGSIKPFSRLLADETCDDMRSDMARIVGDPKRILGFSGDGHVNFALDYNRLNAQGEPAVIRLNLEGEVRFEILCESFGDFLRGQYLGDSEPYVRMSEAASHQLISNEHVQAIHTNTGKAVIVNSLICRDQRRLLIYSESDYGYGTRLEMAEVTLKSIVDGQIYQDTYLAKPDVYVLSVDVQPQVQWAIIHSSVPVEGRWWNRKSESGLAWLRSSNLEFLSGLLERVIKPIAKLNLSSR